MSTDDLSRRDFVRLLGAGAAGAALAACSRAAAVTTTSGGTASASTAGAGYPLGIQLYTVRDPLQRDTAGTLAAIARIGYREVETAGYGTLTPAQFRAELDRNGLVAPSGHIPIDRIRADLPGVVAEARTMGYHWITFPWVPEEGRTYDNFRRIADDLNRAGRAAKDAGMRVAYHNHDFEFQPLAGAPSGMLMYDMLLANTDPSLVDFEMDLYWITHAGKNPVDYWMKNQGRFPMVHVKDMTSTGAMADVGAGTIDFAALFQHAGHAGIKHYFVERDDAPDPLATARNAYAGLRRLRA